MVELFETLLLSTLRVAAASCRNASAVFCGECVSLPPPSVRTGAGSDAQTVSKGIACVLVFSVMPPHPRGHMSFCAFGWDVILYRQSPDAVLEFHDPSDYACYVCTVWETRDIWCLSALP